MIDPCEFANPQLRDLIPYEPGKPIEDVARELGLDPDNVIKLASNENPLGPSPKAIEAMKSLASDVHVYPDGGGWKLRNAIAEKFSLSMDNIVLGNGSNEIIEFVGHSFLKPGDQVIVAEHAFVVYKLMATLFGADTVEVKDIEIALAASKVIREYLNKEGIKNDEINKGMNVYVDKVYGKPFNKKKNSECNKSTYDLIPGSKEKIEKLSRTIYQG